MILNELVRPGDYWIIPVSAVGVLLLGLELNVVAGGLLVTATTALIWHGYGTRRLALHLILTAVLVLSIRYVVATKATDSNLH